MYVASKLGSAYHVFFINICLGKPRLGTLNALALLCSQRQEKYYLLIHISCFCW